MDELPIKEYINKNYVSKDKIRELIKYKRKLITDIETITLGKIKTAQERSEIARLQTEIYELKQLLNE